MKVVWLLARRYGLACFVAVFLHVVILAALDGLIAVTADESRFIVEPKPLRAQLIRLNVTQAPPVESTTPSVPAPQKERDATPQEESETKDEQLARLAKERAERLLQIRESAFQELVVDEIANETASAIQDLAQVYIEGIYLSLVTNWSRPPSARNNMSVIIQVELFPNGDLNTVTVIESSGDDAFDRSAVVAVERAAPFVVPQEIELFEERFRSFTLNFRPEDLLR